MEGWSSASIVLDPAVPGGLSGFVRRIRTRCTQVVCRLPARHNHSLRDALSHLSTAFLPLVFFCKMGIMSSACSLSVGCHTQGALPLMLVQGHGCYRLPGTTTKERIYVHLNRLSCLDFYTHFALLGKILNCCKFGRHPPQGEQLYQLTPTEQLGPTACLKRKKKEKAWCRNPFVNTVSVFCVYSIF